MIRRILESTAWYVGLLRGWHERYGEGGTWEEEKEEEEARRGSREGATRIRFGE